MVRLNRTARQKKKQPDDGKSISATTIASLKAELQEDMISVGDAIIAGVKKAQQEADSDIDSDGEKTTNTSLSKRSKASSGSIGDFIRQKRSRRERS